ncbi:hypothetical protein B0H21DRAFT_687977, partial [Amylocystis lapponica]
YRLCGIIYYGGFHFTSRIIMSDGSIWFNDGISTGNMCKLEGNIVNVNQNVLAKSGTRKSCAIIYGKI